MDNVTIFTHFPHESIFLQNMFVYSPNVFTEFCELIDFFFKIISIAVFKPTTTVPGKHGQFRLTLINSSVIYQIS